MAGQIDESAGPKPRTVLSSLDGWAAISVLLPTAVALSGRMGTVDLAYHVRLGEQMHDSGNLARVDDMTFTDAGQPWIDQQWVRRW